MPGEARRGGKPAAAPRKDLAAKLEKLGLRNDADLLLHLPLRYEDETRISPIAALRPGEPAQIEVEVVASEVTLRPRRQLVCQVRDDSGALTLRFLTFYPGQSAQLAAGARLRVFGEARGGFFGLEMVHPRYRLVEAGEPLPESLLPVYPTTAGLAQSALRKLVDRALARHPLADTLPEPVRSRYRLPEFAPSLRLLHHPPPGSPVASLCDRTHPAWQRVKFDELLAQQISLRQAHAARRERSAPALPPRQDLTARLLSLLPFAVTGAQERAGADFAGDVAQPYPMQRLLQGDVGSGKTIVAALAMLQAVENGFQAALMAPTEILAEQHYRKLQLWLAPLGLVPAWLSGSLKKSDKVAMAARVASGEAQVVVGTHALIEETVEFARLGVAVVDEQHRFGVRQRLALRCKGGSPHQLMMSATPIPRTLAMSYYADLDVSVLDELPPGRTPVVTKVVSDRRRDEVNARERDACAAGRQAYWVCPLIEESEALQLQTAIDTHARLQGELADLSVGLVHGRMKPDEKSAAMAAFARGEIHLLVATTVIEVGVDVPNASLMVIEHAERFGLSQLHQLRGRVGRGAAQSACVLLYSQPLSHTARARLRIIHASSDGFEIARQDLELRGPGEFLGARQSGVAMLRLADLVDDAALLAPAREAAEWMLKDYPEAAARHVARWLGARQDYLKV